MFQEYKSLRSVSIKGSMLEFAESCPNGISYATVISADNTEEAQAPTTGRGYLYIIYKHGNVIQIYANQYLITTRPFMRKYYDGSWGDWVQL